MTAQEEQMIQDLADRINKTPLAEKDPDAELYLQQTLGRNPDAMYILAQTVLVQQYALDQAQKQLADARAQIAHLQAGQQAQPKHATSFLGNLLGMGDDRDDRPRTPPPPPPQSSQQGWTTVQQYGQGGYPPPAPSYAPGYSSGYASGYAPPVAYAAPQQGGFLRGAMQTAAGVAAGAIAFEGIESLMHGFGGGGGYGGYGSGGGRPEEIINNNYYGDSGHEGHEGHLSSDIEDRRGESSSFSDAVDSGDHNFGGDNLGGDSDTGDPGTGSSTDSLDDSSFDSGSGGDDGSFDSGGGDSSY